MAPTAIEANVQYAVPFLWVQDIQRSVQFYTGGLGFTMTRDWIDKGKLRWYWLELDGAAVMLQELMEDDERRHVPAAHAHVGMSVYFVCRDAITLWRGFIARGVSAERPFVGNGMWVAGVQDPDGRSLYFESPTDAPEDTVFTDTDAL